MIENGIRGGKLHAFYCFVEANNKYMKVCDLNKVLSYLM